MGFDLQSVKGYGVRFKGHWCAAVKSGVSRKFILLRARKGEEIFVAPINCFLGSERPSGDTSVADWAQLARLACARAIKRTEWARRKLQGDHMLRGVKSVERLLLDYADHRWRGHKRRWKICEIHAQVLEDSQPTPVNKS